MHSRSPTVAVCLRTYVNAGFRRGVVRAQVAALTPPPNTEEVTIYNTHNKK